MPKPSHSDGESRLKSLLAELIDEGPLLRGTLTLRRRRCGKAPCRCARGELHATWYLVQTNCGRPRQLSIPRQLEPRIREAADRYRQVQGLVERLSEIAWGQLEAQRRRPHGDAAAGRAKGGGLTPEAGRPYNEGVV